MISRRSQVTVFIIVGLLLVAGILLFFLFKAGVVPNPLGRKVEVNSNVFLQQCIEGDLRDALSLIMSQGGYVSNPLHVNFEFEDEKPRNISYLCYTEEPYIPCVNQEPMFIAHLQDEIHEEIGDGVEKCFDSYVRNLEKGGYKVNSSYDDFEVDFALKKVLLKFNASVVADKGGEVSKQEQIGVIHTSRFYDLALVVQEIVGQEAEYCNFEQLGFMLIYDDFNIDKFRTSGLFTIYDVEHRDSKEAFRFAIKSCVIPPGLG